jgi:[ribosomal protein S5]-alanine N-acetyltransferase
LRDFSSVFPFVDLETARLRLQILTLDDAESVYRQFSDDEVTRYMDINSCTRIQDAREIVIFHLEDSGCRWGLFNKKTGALVGTCGYHGWVKNGTQPVAEIGFDLGKAYWGLGLMQEALRTTISFGFNEIKLCMIYASVDPQNRRSIKLLKRLHFQPDRCLRGGRGRLCLYSKDWTVRAKLLKLGAEA